MDLKKKKNILTRKVKQSHGLKKKRGEALFFIVHVSLKTIAPARSFMAICAAHSIHSFVASVSYVMSLVKTPLPAPKTRQRRVRNKHWWDNIVLQDITGDEWKEDFRLFTRPSFMTLYSTTKTGCSVHHMSICHFYIIARHAQSFPVSVFNPIKCLMSVRMD